MKELRKILEEYAEPDGPCYTLAFMKGKFYGSNKGGIGAIAYDVRDPEHLIFIKKEGNSIEKHKLELGQVKVVNENPLALEVLVED